MTTISGTKGGRKGSTVAITQACVLYDDLIESQTTLLQENEKVQV